MYQKTEKRKKNLQKTEKFKKKLQIRVQGFCFSLRTYNLGLNSVIFRNKRNECLRGDQKCGAREPFVNKAGLLWVWIKKNA